MELLKDSDCEIKYHPEKDNVIAYALSRKGKGSNCQLLSIKVEAKSGLLERIKSAQADSLLTENVVDEGLSLKKDRFVLNSHGF